MKLHLPILATFLTLSSSNPIAKPDPEPTTSENLQLKARTQLEGRADVWCKVTVDTVCNINPDIYSTWIRNVDKSGNKFGVRCKEPGWDTNPYWSYIPGWNCYVVTKLTTCQNVPLCFCEEC